MNNYSNYSGTFLKHPSFTMNNYSHLSDSGYRGISYLGQDIFLLHDQKFVSSSYHDQYFQVNDHDSSPFHFDVHFWIYHFCLSQKCFYQSLQGDYLQVYHKTCDRHLVYAFLYPDIFSRHGYQSDFVRYVDFRRYLIGDWILIFHFPRDFLGER